MKTTKHNTFNKSQSDIILRLLEEIGNDGHTVYKECVLEEFPEALQKRFTTTMKSNTRNYKQTLFDKEGNIVKEVRAVYGLDVLIGICEDLKLKYNGSFLGRGFQAQECTHVIKEYFSPKSVAVPV